MPSNPDDPEAFWAEVLSREPERIRLALETLPADERRAVIRHLERMKDEPGWALPQREAARVALSALPKIDPTTDGAKRGQFE